MVWQTIQGLDPLKFAFIDWIHHNGPTKACHCSKAHTGIQNLKTRWHEQHWSSLYNALFCWVLAFMWILFWHIFDHLPTPLHGYGSHWWQWPPQQDNAPHTTPQKNCLRMAQSADLAPKFPRSQSNQAPAGCTGTSLIQAPPHNSQGPNQMIGVYAFAPSSIPQSIVHKSVWAHAIPISFVRYWSSVTSKYITLITPINKNEPSINSTVMLTTGYYRIIDVHYQIHLNLVHDKPFFQSVVPDPGYHWYLNFVNCLRKTSAGSTLSCLVKIKTFVLRRLELYLGRTCRFGQISCIGIQQSLQWVLWIESLILKQKVPLICALVMSLTLSNWLPLCL